MDFLTSDIRQLYRKFLISSMGSTLAMSIYAFVDAIAVGQSEGPAGTAAMAVITPLYGILIFLGISCGIGGSVLMSESKGAGQREKGDSYFTAALIPMGVLSIAFWIVMGLFHRQIFTFFGADEHTLPKVMEYAKWIIRFFPVFVIPAFLSAFIRNDGAPGLAMGAVITGGVVNMLGDWFLVFPLGMGIEGAAIATVIGNSLQTLIMCGHFFRDCCHLKLVRPPRITQAVGEILTVGFSAGALELGNIILAVILNNQVMNYGGAAALSVYGVIATISSLIQSLYSGAGQAIQPIVSSNYGAGEKGRIRTTLRMSMRTVIVMGILFAGVGELFPEQIIALFMEAPTPSVLAIAPIMIRTYFLLFLFLGITVLATYYLQSITDFQASIVIAISRSIVVSGLLLFVLPVFFGLSGVLTAMPLSELMVSVIAVIYINRLTRFLLK